MKKIVLPIIVLIIAIALIAPKIVSTQFASGLQNAVDTVNKNPGYVASINNIESGWFSSQAEVSVGIDVPEMADVSGQALNMSVDLIVNAQHGPVLTQSGFALGWLDTKLSTQTGELPPGLLVKDEQPIYQFAGVTGLFMSTSYQDSVAALEYTDPNNQGLIVFSGMQGEGEFSGSGIRYEALSESVNMDVPGVVTVDIEQVQVMIDSAESFAVMLKQGLYDSESVFSIKSIVWKDLIDQTQSTINDTKLMATSYFDEASGLGGVNMTTSIASMNLPVDGETQIDDMTLAFEVNNLQAKFFVAYQEFMNTMAENGSSPVQMQDDMNAFMQEHVLEQLQANPEYNITDLSGKINGSTFNGKALAKLEGVTELPMTLEDPSFWMQHTNLDSTLSVEKVAAEFIAKQVVKMQLAGNPQFAAMPAEQQEEIIAQQVSPTLEGMVQQGMLTLNNEVYEFSFALQSGIATLNGNPIPL